VGGFDYIDSIPYSNFAKLSMVAGSGPVAIPATISGPDTIYANRQPNIFSVTPVNTSLYSYQWTFSDDSVTISGNGFDTVRLAAAPTAVSGNLVVKAMNYCGSVQVAQKPIVVAAPPPQLPLPVVTGLNGRCFQDPTSRAKLMNPPSTNVAITIKLDGISINYNATDSSFQYFTTQQTDAGNHTISVKYKYTYATRDSVSKDFGFYVIVLAPSSISLNGNTAVNSGEVTTISTTINNGGSNPPLQWQDSTQTHSWQNIAGTSGYLISYTPVATGNKIRCIMTVDAPCIVPTIVTSPSLVFTVTVVTAVNPSPSVSKTIRLYPNPAETYIIIDSLRLSDHWKSIEIIDMAGQKTITSYSIQNKTMVIVPIDQLERGAYMVLLRRKDGVLALKRFIKL
jgi:hypothetical protein